MEKLCLDENFALFLTVGCLLVQWTFHPFIFKAKKIYTVLLWCRVLAFLVVSAESFVYLNVLSIWTDELPLFYLALLKTYGLE